MRQAAKGRREFLIKWEKYDGPETWEPEANLLPPLVREFLESQAADETENLEAAPAAADKLPPAVLDSSGDEPTSGQHQQPGQLSPSKRPLQLLRQWLPSTLGKSKQRIAPPQTKRKRKTVPDDSSDD